MFLTSPFIELLTSAPVLKVVLSPVLDNNRGLLAQHGQRTLRSASLTNRTLRDIVVPGGQLMSVVVRRRFVVIAGGCLVVSLTFALAAPKLLRWRVEQSEHSAPQELRQVNEAVKAYIAEHGTNPPTLSSLRGRIPSELSCGTPTCDSFGYRFQYAVSSQDPSKPHYSLSAQPLHHGISGIHSYYVDQTDVLRYTKENRAATSNDPPLPY